jgi:hypothetical protein
MLVNFRLPMPNSHQQSERVSNAWELAVGDWELTVCSWTML